MAYFELSDGTPLYYQEKGEGRPLVLLHALMFPANYFWQKNFDELARNNRVIAIDLRGQGLSGKPNHGYTLNQMAKDVQEVLEGLNLDGVALAGLALGGLTILEYLKTFGTERLDRLILIDFTPRLTSTPGWDHPTFGDFSEEAAAGFAAGARADRSILRDFLAGTFGEMPDPETFAEMYAQTCLMPTDAVADMIEDMARQDYREVAKSIDLPTLLLYAGAKNVTLPTPVGDWMHENIKGSELVMFDDSGHSLFWEEPDKFNKVVAEFASK